MNRSQLRAARALLGWSQERLADASGVSIPTIKRLEPGEGLVQTRVDTLDKLRRALEAAGVEFTNGGEPGVKLRRRDLM
ncbi:helix-turn-helix domain-containing protein [Methylobacterium sp. J-030]|uniref:helix-turn-helix domain-containing protein n=1 Tax=Methylobacterium sp. J-030 TaxID=2836627 RepID=UPI001FBA593B|nr:helix-turn-helix domain-containing protein [Methylobacterium sp. J-030]MCJ2068523.1 helix-turn-helix domain-containing protein [Methylobacterium sp. J-030]